MKILHIEAGRNLYGGALQVLYLIKGLQESRHDNVLVCPEQSEIAAHAHNTGARIHAIPMRGDFDLPFIGRLRQIIAREQPDIVHLHSRRGADVLGGIAARLAHTKVVLTRRVDNHESSLQVRLKYRLFDKVIAISGGIRNILISEGVPAEKVVCVRSAIDIKQYGLSCADTWFRKEFGLAQDVRVIGMVAQFIERKGHRYLLQAIPGILSKYPRVKFILFGKGPLEEGIRAMALAAGMQSSLLFAGFRNDLERVLPCLYAIVHPAEMEGLGVALLQAAACRVPLVGTDTGGIPEIVIDGVDGYLIPPRSPQAIAAAVLKLLDDPVKARAMGEAARAIVEKEFSIDAMVAGNLGVYRELMDTL